MIDEGEEKILELPASLVFLPPGSEEGDRPEESGAVAVSHPPIAELHLWPYRSLPLRGFVTFMVITLLLMIPIHAGAALKHHLIDRDDVFHAMLPVVPLLRPKRTRWQRRWSALEKRVASTARTLWRGLLGPKAI